MNKIILISILALSSFACTGQLITESIVNFKKNYNRVWTKESAVMSFDFIKTYIVGKTDTVSSFLIKISNSSLEMESVSIGYSGFAIGGILGGGISGGNNYDVKNRSDEIILSKDEFLELYDQINDVFKFVVFKEINHTKNENNIIASGSIDGLSFVGEYLPDNNLISRVKFYFKFTEENIFDLTKTEFEEIIKIIRDVKNLWTNGNKS